VAPQKDALARQTHLSPPPQIHFLQRKPQVVHLLQPQLVVFKVKGVLQHRHIVLYNPAKGSEPGTGARLDGRPWSRMPICSARRRAGGPAAARHTESDAGGGRGRNRLATTSQFSLVLLVLGLLVLLVQKYKY
jgi:hypothetical protein